MRRKSPEKIQHMRKLRAERSRTWERNQPHYQPAPWGRPPFDANQMQWPGQFTRQYPIAVGMSPPVRVGFDWRWAALGGFVIGLLL